MKENLMRMIYCEMLGHDASFGFIHAVNYTQKGKLKDKRLGKKIFFFTSLLFFLVKLAKVKFEKVSHESVFLRMLHQKIVYYCFTLVGVSQYVVWNKEIFENDLSQFGKNCYYSQIWLFPIHTAI